MAISLETVRRRMREDAPVQQLQSTPSLQGAVQAATSSIYPDDLTPVRSNRPTNPLKPVAQDPNNPIGLTPVRDSGTPPPPLKPPVTTTPPMSTGYPPVAGTPGGGTPAPSPVAPTTPFNGVVNSQINPQELTSVNLQQLLQSNSPYIQAAERAGQRTAQSRGLLNSSMAAGASRRAAIEAGAPIAESDAQAYRGAATQTRDFLYRDALANNDTQRQDWLASSAYTRDFNGRLAMMPIASSFDFFNSAMQAALEDPSVYPPEVINSLSQFNMQQLNQLLAQYLGTGRP